MSTPDPREALRRQRCRGFELAMVLGVVLTVFSLYDRTWPGVGVGVVGTLLALGVWRRNCRGREAA
jgi:hypothetical protein